MMNYEINKIIGQYMGFNNGFKSEYEIPQIKLIWEPIYTDSLDALIPVTEKLGGGFLLLFNHPSCRHEVETLDSETEEIKYISKHMRHSVALATACAQAIKELK